MRLDSAEAWLLFGNARRQQDLTKRTGRFHPRLFRGDSRAEWRAAQTAKVCACSGDAPGRPDWPPKKRGCSWEEGKTEEI